MLFGGCCWLCGCCYGNCYTILPACGILRLTWVARLSFIMKMFGFSSPFLPNCDCTQKITVYLEPTTRITVVMQVIFFIARWRIIVHICPVKQYLLVAIFFKAVHNDCMIKLKVTAYVAVPCRNRWLFCQIFWSHCCVWSAVLLNFC